MRTYQDIMGNQISGKTLAEVLNKLSATFSKEEGYWFTWPHIGRSINVFKHEAWQMSFTEILEKDETLDLTHLAAKLYDYGAVLKSYYVYPKAPHHLDMTIKGITEKTLPHVKELIESEGLRIASCVYLEKGTLMVPEMYPFYSIHAVDLGR